MGDRGREESGRTKWDSWGELGRQEMNGNLLGGEMDGRERMAGWRI